LTCGVTESPTSSTIEGLKATLKGGAPGGAPSESHTDRAALNVFDLYPQALLLGRHSVKRQPVISAHLRGAISVIGQSRKLGQGSSSKRTRCIIYLQKKRSTASLRRKRLEASFVTSTMPSDLQAEKSAPYKNPSYEAVLEREAGSYMDNIS
jgi:hypothetical protein